MEGDKGRVCVTGGTGFLASWLIKRLLEHGYSINTTIRPDPEHKRDISFLTSLPGATKKLKIFQADLSDSISFDEAIKGCIGLFHVATPVDLENKEPEPVVTKRAIDGTLGILKSCLNSHTIKRVVYTSSASAVEYIREANVDLLDESTWSDVDYIKILNSRMGPYAISKTLTEKRALQFAEEHGLELVTVIPSFIVGPFICHKFPGSVSTSLALVLGKEDLYNRLLSVSMVHTDDVARAHIFLFENPDSKFGRYICSSHRLTIQELSEFLSTKYPEYPIPSVESLKDVQGFKSIGMTSKKLLAAGFRYQYGIEDMFDGAIKCCREKGYL